MVTTFKGMPREKGVGWVQVEEDFKSDQKKNKRGRGKERAYDYERTLSGKEGKEKKAC